MRNTGTLDLFEADLLIDGSFDEAVRGSHYVFHVAAPLPAPGVCNSLYMHPTDRGIARSLCLHEILSCHAFTSSNDVPS